MPRLRSLVSLWSVVLVASGLLAAPVRAEVVRTIFSDDFELEVAGAPPSKWQIFTVAHFNDNHATRWTVENNPAAPDSRNVSGGGARSLAWNDVPNKATDNPNPPDWSSTTRDDFPLGVVYRQAELAANRPGALPSYTLRADLRIDSAVNAARLTQNATPVATKLDAQGNIPEPGECDAPGAGCVEYTISRGAVVGSILWPPPPADSQPCPDNTSQTCIPAGALAGGLLVLDRGAIDDDRTDDIVKVGTIYVSGFVNQDDVAESGLDPLVFPTAADAAFSVDDVLNATHTVQLHVIKRSGADAVGLTIDGTFYGWGAVQNPDGSAVRVDPAKFNGYGMGGLVRDHVRYDNLLYQEGYPDPAAIDTTLDSTPPALQRSEDAVFEFSSNRRAAGFECSLDGGAFTACASPHTIASVTDGSHTFAVRAKDAVDTDPTPSTYSWSVDSPPTTTITGAPDALTNSTDATFTFEASEPATFTCALDGGPAQACSSPKMYTGLAEGPHTFLVQATDSDGVADTEVDPPTHAWTVDTTAPAVTFTDGPDDPAREGSASFTFAADEAATFECSLDGAAFASCSSPAGVDGLDQGTHSFQVRATDGAGNQGLGSYGWTVDLLPETTIDSGPPALTNSGEATFTFSASEPSSFECSLDGGAFSACASPQAYAGLADGPHGFAVRAVDLDGTNDADPSPATHEWTVDLTAPAVTFTQQPADPARTSSATFAFSASEPSTFRCSLDGAPFAACASPVSHSGLAQGPHTFAVKATDGAGNEGTASVSWTVDLFPETTIQSGPPSLTNSPDASFSFTASEPSTFECSLDGAAFGPCVSPQSYTGLVDGEHTFAVRAVDTDGSADADPSPATRTWTVDTTPPSVTIDSGPDDPSRADEASFSFSASEAASFECALDGAAFAPCASPSSYGDLAQGSHTFAVRATDAAGNTSATVSRTWTVDLIPDTAIDSAPTTPTNSPDAVFSFSATEPSSFECSLDGAAFAPCASPQGYTGLVDGEHTFAVRAVDADGTADADPSPATHVWTIDSVAPSVAIDSGPANPSRTDQADIAFSASEPASFECSLDGGAFAPCSSPVSYAGLAQGSHSFGVRGTDAAGNISSTATHSWTVDLIPETTIDSAPPAVSNSPAATFAFSSSEPASFECSLDGAAFAACTSPHAYADLPDGDHTFAVRAVDLDAPADADPSPATVTWRIDTIAPETTILSGPPTVIEERTASFTFSASEPATFQCSLNGAGFSACSSAPTFTNLAEGDYTLEVRAVDAAGNVDASPATWSWTVAASPPPAPEARLESDADGDGAVNAAESGGGERFALGVVVPFDGTQQADVVVSVSDGEATVASPVQTAQGSAPLRFELDVRTLADGPVTVTVSATRAGQATTTTFDTVLDLHAPVTSITTADGSVFLSVPYLFLDFSNVKITGTVSDAVSTQFVVVRFRNEDTGATYGPYVAKRSGPPGAQSWVLDGYAFEPGRYTVTAHAQDEAGNVESPPDSATIVVL